MGLEELEKEIIENGRKGAERIIKEGSDEAAVIAEGCKKKEKELRAKAEAEIKTALEQLEKKETSLAEFNSRKALLETKKMLLDGLFEKISARLERLNETSRAKHIGQLIARAKKRIDIYAVHCSGQDRKHVKGCECLEAPISGGIIVENRDKSERIDLSYETILEQVKEKHLGEIGRMLFGR